MEINILIITYGGAFFMKRALSVILTVCIIVSIGTVALSATAVTTTAAASGPDWVITEICPDTVGKGIGGYTDNKDPYEFIEIYNNSGSTLNLYDYCMTYNGNARTNADFETKIVEITPFKAGDYSDGSTHIWTDTSKYTPCDLSNKPVNPATCMVAPGEVVVLWVMYYEAYLNLFNEGKGLSLANFREFWSIPENVKVISVDGNSSTTYGGNDKNFNIKNSDVGTYGIALYSEALNTAANTLPDGAVNFFPVVYTDSPELAAWASVDFKAQLLAGTLGDATFNFTVDKQGYGASEWGYVNDARRMILLESYAEASVGTLTTAQKLTLGVALEAGDTLSVDALYTPTIDNYTFAGFEINGTLYAPGSTFTAAAAGVCSFSYKYIDNASTTAPAVTTKAPDTTTKAPTTTKTPTTTAAPGTDAAPATTAAPTTTASTAGDDKGCGSLIGFGLIASLIPAAVIISRKKQR